MTRKFRVEAQLLPRPLNGHRFDPTLPRRSLQTQLVLYSDPLNITFYRSRPQLFTRASWGGGHSAVTATQQM